MASHLRPGGGGDLPELLIGREADLRRMDALLRGLPAAGSALVISGEPGVGKTALLAAVAARAVAIGVRVLHATGTPFEAQTGFGAIRQLLTPVLDEIDALGRRHREVLTVALGQGTGPAPGHEDVARAVLSLLTGMSRRRPLLLILDDLQWMDPTSALVLGGVARRLLGTRAGLLAAERPEVGGYFDHTGCATHLVEPLTDDAAEFLLVSRFPNLAAAVRHRLMAEAQGNPLALLELPVPLTRAQRTATARLPAHLPLSDRLQAVFASRVEALPAITRYLLLLAALEGTGDLDLLQAAVAGRSSVKQLGPAEHARLIRVDDRTGRLTFRHPLIRLAVVDLSTSGQRRSAHLALARPLDDQPERQAWHLGQATVGADEKVAELLERAARSMSRRGDGTLAIAALLRAADLSADRPQRARRLAEAAHLGACITGDLYEVPQLLDDARRAAPGPAPLAAAVAGASYLLNSAGDIDTAHHLLSSAVALQPTPYDPQDPTAVEALHTLLLVCFFGGRPELWGSFDASLGRFRADPGILTVTRATFADPVRCGREHLAQLDAEIAGLPYESDPVHIIRVGIAAAYVDRLGGCVEALTRVAEAGRKGQAVALAINALFLRGNHALHTGQWEQLGRVAHEGLALCQDHGFPMLAWAGNFLLAARAAAQGDYAAAEKLTDEMDRWAWPRQVGVVRFYAAHVRTLAALGRGDYEDAYQQATSVLPAGNFPPFVPHALWMLLDLTEAAVRAGRRDEARAHVAAAREAGIDALSPRLAMLLHALAALAADGDARIRYERALAVPGAERWPFDLARIHLCYGEHLRRAKATAEARHHLAVAADAFRRLGAVPWATRAAQELRATGGHRESPQLLTGVPLTPQQREIAKLAAAGLTNKEIGERLFLSPRTVSTHLHQLFPKLGVTSRAALRDALDRLASDDDSTPAS
ncbi:AAA family ATPase (plasmid) [Streptomyces sp. NBC_00841]|uniref:helix-turn-helix transcriptional regulator n=1 Tax=unclassified Streptomyces TaxID=2593676 RepID=UPI002251AC3D|nr:MULTISPECIES: LuxR family transcriptional regulator [unclassified Streptomyces]MCX4538421.1 AAA family ATPase [Streptomyces sp. NBC_01669]WSA05746.1 AAA family ATPase [Streptomyces sp. NBC_00841]